MKKLATLIILVMLTACFAGTAMAQEAVITDDSPIVIQGTPVGSSGISSNGKSVTYSAVTTSAQVEDIITVTAFLQEYRNGIWYDISSVARTKYYTVSVTTSRIVTVSGGHYYRTRGVHTTTNDGVIKSKTSYSPRIWVS